MGHKRFLSNVVWAAQSGNCWRNRMAGFAVRGEFSCVGEGRRVDSRSPWPGAGGSRSRISPPRRRRKNLPNQTASASVRGLMNSTATRTESRSVIGAVRGEFSCVGEGRRADSRSSWPGAGGSRSRISAPRRRRKGLPNQTASASVRGLMNSTATRIESRPVIDAVRGEFSCVGDDRRVDSRSPWPGAGGSRSRISPPRRRRKGLPNQTASASVWGLMNSTAAKMESRPIIDAVRGEFSCVGEGRRVDSRSRGRELVVRAPGFQRRDGEERACRIKRLPLVCGA